MPPIRPFFHRLVFGVFFLALDRVWFFQRCNVGSADGFKGALFGSLEAHERDRSGKPHKCDICMGKDMKEIVYLVKMIDGCLLFFVGACVQRSVYCKAGWQVDYGFGVGLRIVCCKIVREYVKSQVERM